MPAAERALVIGLDAPIVKRILKHSEEGKNPNITKLIKNGVWAKNCLVPHPTIAPPNWTTIVTAAWPGTHGITDMHLHKPSWPLDHTPFAFSSLDCEAEYIWQAAERSGRGRYSPAIHPLGPQKGKKLIQICGGGLWMNS